MLRCLVKESTKWSRALVQQQRPSLSQQPPGSSPFSALTTNNGCLIKSVVGDRSHNHRGAIRHYSQSHKVMDEAEGGGDGEEVETEAPPLFTRKDKVVAARDYNIRRADYNRQVSLLRKQYAGDIAKKKAAEEKQQEIETKAAKRRYLEKQRLKNIRSAQNALKEEDKREERAEVFQEHLRAKQEEREERNRKFQLARQMVIDELESEAGLWLTSPEEVDAAFTHEAEQLLWARSNGVLGSPSPSVDSHFWQYESHTMHLDKTYRTPRDLLLEEMLENIYEEATVDETVWTPERQQDHKALEDKAKLRAMVRAEGRRALLNKQKELLESYYGTSESEVPKRMPAPNVKVLANIPAQESEGVDILLNDPTKFFRFDNEQSATGGSGGKADATYSGPTMGAPVGLKDPLRDGSPWKGVFPIGIAKVPKADNRTQREKKRQEREQKMWEAAMAEKVNEDDEIDMAASDEMMSAGDPIDYDDNEWDSDDEEWEKGLDPVEDADLLNTPPERRYTEEDLRWVVSQLELRSEYLHSQMTREVDSTRQRLRTQRDVDAETPDQKVMQDLLLSLSDEQMLALVEVDAQDLQAMSPNELSEALGKVPGLQEDQVKKILELDVTLEGGGSGKSDS